MKTITITDRSQIEDIIRKCPYCTVGIIDGEGNPYVIPMNFAWEMILFICIRAPKEVK